MDTVIFSPHQDDEILSSFLLLSELKEEGREVAVVYVTNGDYKGRDSAKIRYRESLQALALCGITANNVIYMGYGDTGMKESHSFMNRLYHSAGNTLCKSSCSQCTYHPTEGNTYHYQIYHEEALYTRYNLENDLRFIINQLHPRNIVIPSLYDQHYDHSTIAKFILEITTMLKLNIYSYLIHSTDESIWPPRNTDIWICPPSFPKNVWNKRIQIKNSKAALLKMKAIKCFTSQRPYALNGFLLSFAKNEEIFFPVKQS